MPGLSRFLRSGILAAAVLSPSVAFAHSGFGEASGLLHGFMHTVSGLDHILAMVTVGVLAYSLGGRALLLVPSTFLLVMMVGGTLGVAGIYLPFIELGIALSIVVLGGVVALRIQAPVVAAMATVGLFALFHGHAHGTEMAEATATGAVTYGVGFVAATALLHLMGIGFGFMIAHSGNRYRLGIIRAAGGLISIAGVAILAGFI